MMKMEAAFQTQLEDQVSALKDEYPKITGKIVTGNTFLEIIRVARDDDVDMIVMGTHGRTGLAHVLKVAKLPSSLQELRRLLVSGSPGKRPL